MKFQMRSSISRFRKKYVFVLVNSFWHKRDAISMYGYFSLKSLKCEENDSMRQTNSEIVNCMQNFQHTST